MEVRELLAIVTESVSAYKICKQRMDAVKQALKTAHENSNQREHFHRRGPVAHQSNVQAMALGLG